MELILITEESQVDMTANMDCSPGDCSPVNYCNPDDESVEMESSDI